MDKLPSALIGIYVEKIEQGGFGYPSRPSSWRLAVNVFVPLFRVFYKLCKHGHWFSFENKVGGRARKCFKEVTSSLKGWKKKFFLIDRRAMPAFEDRGAHFGVISPAKNLEKSDLKVVAVREKMHPSLSADGGGSEADGSEFHFVPDWRLQEYLQIFTYRAYLCNRNEIDRGKLDRDRNEILSISQANADLSKEFSLLSSAHSSCLDNKRVLLDRLKEVETGRDDWRCTTSKQVGRTKGLEASSEAQGKLLAIAEERVWFLEGENVKLAAGMAKEEMSIAVPVSLSFTAGWLCGLSLERTPDQIEELIAQSDNLDVEGSKTWKAKHRELFTKSYPFIQKVSDSYRLPFESLMKLIPDASSSALADRTTTPTETLTPDGALDHAVIEGFVPET
nr:hypothetical protein [Tanacetum cinerariifolium]